MQKSSNINSKLVSVIITVFNSFNHLRYCLDSIIQQTHKNLEIIIIDDFSSDNSPEIINEYVKKDSRIKFIALDENRGYLEATNIGLKLATGEFITFLDSDDTCPLNRIELQLSYLNDNCLDLVGTNCNIIDKHGNKISTIEYPRYNGVKGINSIRACGSSVLFKRNILHCVGLFNPLFSRIGSEDFEWLLRCTKKYKFENMKYALYNYRKHENSITTDLKSEHSLYRSISHILAEKLVAYFHKNLSNNYWKKNEVQEKFEIIKTELIEKEKKYPINVLKRETDSMIFNKFYYEAIKKNIHFIWNHKRKLSAYILLLKTIIKSIILKLIR
ncbi:glycosyltransferase family 2 protein [Xenorhabdus hominickii]|uniref:Lipopolysaccharide biosynthesis protein n=1 Tax=Xenorhabdus hominickii TaxID=351679 RepID=A0A2G0QEQ7_XENHO|nr:glycosyltransferase family 2 protein [Xenorhabdus hominickii]AOM41729.1 hypothetical protein A9255_14880 [Xenorhabdus hominickii]PHM57686.1 lipopolysaccharide biosynthesis protein [Xenorhabdus hominickii]